ncbi:hypothetical protein [Streptomyces sp. PR69]|uniref:hypothetical protein n=1 Tax=Streptomyces sp. PR69 TaxID=2984950 RepID=UPI002264A72E|nr:hypothetical protein [Streptomyces sp. PR69]
MHRLDEEVDQIVFRWDSDNASSTTGFGPVAFSCEPGRANGVFRRVAALLRATGEETLPALIRIEHDDRALLVHRRPQRDELGRTNAVCHALFGSARVLDAGDCLGLHRWNWHGGDLDAGGVRGRLDRVRAGDLLRSAEAGTRRLALGLAASQEELTGVVAQSLRHPRHRLTLLDGRGGDSACRVLWGVHGIFGALRRDGWTFATHDTAESTDLRFVFVRRWPAGAAQDSVRLRVDPLDHIRDRAHEVAAGLVRHHLSGVARGADGELAVGEALCAARERLGGGGAPGGVLDIASRALSDLDRAPSRRRGPSESLPVTGPDRTTDLTPGGRAPDDRHGVGSCNTPPDAAVPEPYPGGPGDRATDGSRDHVSAAPEPDDAPRPGGPPGDRVAAGQLPYGEGAGGSGSDRGRWGPRDRGDGSGREPRGDGAGGPVGREAGSGWEPYAESAGAGRGGSGGGAQDSAGGWGRDRAEGPERVRGWHGEGASGPAGGRGDGSAPEPYAERPGPERAAPGSREAAAGRVPYAESAGGEGAAAAASYGTGAAGRPAAPLYGDDAGAPASGSTPAPEVYARPYDQYAAAPQGQARSRADARTAPPLPRPDRAPGWQTPQGEVPVVPPQWRGPDRPPRRLPRLGRRPGRDLQTLLDGLRAQPESPSVPVFAADDALIDALNDALRQELPYEATTLLLAEIARRWPRWPHRTRRELCFAVLDLDLLVMDDRPGGPGDDLRAANAVSLYRWAVRPLGDDPQVAGRLAELLPRLSQSDRAGRAAFRQIVEGAYDDDARLDPTVWRALVTTAYGWPPRPGAAASAAPTALATPAAPAARSHGWGPGRGTRTVRPAAGGRGSQDGRWAVTTMVCLIVACVGLIVLLAQLA